MAELDLARVKRNVGKMVGMGAPESDIDAYIASEGTSVDAVRSFGFSGTDTASGEMQGPQAPHPAVRPLASLGGNYEQARHEAQDLMTSGIVDLASPTGGDLLGSAGAALKGVGKLGLGGLSYITSPISGAVRSIVGTPGEEALGIPREISEPLASLAIPIPSRIPMPRMARTAEKAEIPAARSIDELKSSYVAARKSPEVAAAKIKPEATARNAEITTAELEKDWLDPELAPKTHYILKKLQTPPEGSSTTMANVDSARRLLGRLAGKGDEEAAAAQIAKGKLDEWVGGLSDADALSGSPTAAHGILQAGRADYSTAKLAEALDSKLTKAELQASGTYSGLNQQNAIKQKVTQFLNSDESRSLNTTERAAAEAVVNGTAPEKVVRFVANLLGGGGGMGTLASGAAGHALAGPGGLLAPLAGFGLNRLEMIRSRPQLGKQIAGPVEEFSKAAEAAEISPTARNLSRLTIASRNLSNNLKDADINIAPNELLKSLFGQQKAAADNNE
jgi:hypothetical protein